MNKKNLFLESFSHLKEKREDITFPEDLLDSLEEKKPRLEEKSNQPVIFLGKGKNFFVLEEAFRYLIDLPKKELPVHYRNSLTKSFLNGNEKGQIISLFKDWKNYKEQVIPKIREFFSYVKEKKDETSRYFCYIKQIMEKKDPMSSETFENGNVDLLFFKFWVIFKFYTLNRGKQ